MSSSHIEWSDDLLLGFGPMDDTHRDFVEKLAALQCCSVSDVAATLQAMRDHCQEHFAQEGEWMESTQMPGRDCHIDEHAAVLTSIDEVLAQLRSAFTPQSIAVAHDLARELGTWFPGHAQHLDSALSHWMSMQRFGGKPMVIRRMRKSDEAGAGAGQ